MHIKMRLKKTKRSVKHFTSRHGFNLRVTLQDLCIIMFWIIKKVKLNSSLVTLWRFHKGDKIVYFFSLRPRNMESLFSHSPQAYFKAGRYLYVHIWSLLIQKYASEQIKLNWFTMYAALGTNKTILKSHVAKNNYDIHPTWKKCEAVFFWNLRYFHLFLKFKAL